MDNLQGRGTNEGDPVMGTHTWPALNNAVFVAAEDDKLQDLISRLNEMNNSPRNQGLKAFKWDLELVVD